MSNILADILTFLAIHAGAISPPVHISAAPAVSHHKAHTAHKVAVRIPLPRARIAPPEKKAGLPIKSADLPPTPMVVVPVQPAPTLAKAVEPPGMYYTPHRFEWGGVFALPPKWVQIWAFVG